MIESWDAWMDHAADMYGRDGQTGHGISEQKVLGKRKRGGCKDAVLGAEKKIRLN